MYRFFAATARFKVLRRLLAAAALLLLIGVAVWLALGPASTGSIAAQWVLLALASTALALWLWIELKPKDSDLGSHVQTFSAVFTIIAVFIAAGIYFLEGRDKVRIAFSLETSVVRLPGSGEQKQVLLAIRVPIENKGQRPVSIQCIGIDVQRPATEEGDLQRSRTDREEMQLQRIAIEPIAYETPRSTDCINRMVRRHHRSREIVRPLFMWPMLTLSPAEVDDVHFEVPVSCTLPFVRVLLKIRVNPDDAKGYETKTIVPLHDICQGTTDTGEGVSTPSLGTGTENPSPSAPSPQPAH